MKYLVLAVLAVSLLFVACNDAERSEFSHPYSSYFYPYDSIPKVYVYRDVVHGLDEQFRKVYGVNDFLGRHIIIETYVERGRLTEIYTVSADSLHVINHTVVNASNQPLSAVLYKSALMPENVGEMSWKASKYPGHIDSTMLLDELKRTIQKTTEMEVLGKQQEALICSDTIRWTLIQPFTQQQAEQSITQTSYFAKGIGLVEFHGPQKKAHYKLEKILSNEEWEAIVKN